MSTGGEFDLVIVGGGINGAGIARDAAGRGLRVLLVEQAGLAHYTSSASTKLVHGGLRYLEYFQFRLVREALLERERLLTIAPHLVHRMRFVLPYEPHLRPAWMVRLGLFFYDHLVHKNTLERSSSVRFATSSFGRPMRPTLRHGFAYSDCTVDDSRLVILNVKDAAEHGAVVRVGCRLVGAEREGGLWRVEIEDQAHQATTVSARAIANAAGPWVAEVLTQRLRGSSEQAVRLVKGSHIVVRRLYDGDHAYVLQHPDRRIVFAIPYQNDFTLIGTTDVPWQGDPGVVVVDPVEVDYLCRTVNAYFERQIEPGDVVWSYSGVRPLWDDSASDASAVTRDYVLDVDAPPGEAPVLSVFGGKITTYRRLAEHALKKLEPYLGPMPAPWTESAPLPGGDIPGADMEAFIADVRRRWPFLVAAHARRLAHAYGTRIAQLLAGVACRDDLGEDFGGGLTRVEVDFLLHEEWATSAEDLYWRHSKTGLYASPADERRLVAYLQTARGSAGDMRSVRTG
ncbi:MAG: D-erythritol 1-phosphate dehydrogenase [Gammaproteobacteria bacterium]|nr:D-erythritol 1-phosphate dehydrogenase [Gammaproteobacteria bacterium]